jgi:hypothetical protein
VAALWEREVGVATPLRPKNTGDLQGRKSAKYNIRPCNRDKKGNRYETIKNSEKNRKEQREKQERTALLAATKKPADEQRRATVAQIRD